MSYRRVVGRQLRLCQDFVALDGIEKSVILSKSSGRYVLSVASIVPRSLLREDDFKPDCHQATFEDLRADVPLQTKSLLSSSSLVGTWRERQACGLPRFAPCKHSHVPRMGLQLDDGTLLELNAESIRIHAMREHVASTTNSRRT